MELFVFMILMQQTLTFFFRCINILCIIIIISVAVYYFINILQSWNCFVILRSDCFFQNCSIFIKNKWQINARYIFVFKCFQRFLFWKFIQHKNIYTANIKNISYFIISNFRRPIMFFEVTYYDASKFAFLLLK